MARLTPVLIAMLGVVLLRTQPSSPPSVSASVSTLTSLSPSPTRQVPSASTQAPRGVGYEDITVAAGLSGFRHVSGGAEPRNIIEATGSGAAIWDFDNDGLVDIYLLNGSSLDRLRAGRAAPPAALFRNNGDGTFTDVTAKTGLANERWGQGVCVGDVDNDGVEDVYVTNVGKNRLYHRAATATAPATTPATATTDRFEDIAEKAGVAVDGWSTGCAFGDFDGDGWLDLFVAGYVALDLAHLPPTRGAGAPDHLFRNNHDGTFTDVSAAAGVADAEGRRGLGVAWFDVDDDDGRLDLLVANDSGPNYLYRNLGNGRFEDVSLDRTTSYVQRARLFWNLDARRFEEIAAAAAGAGLTMPRTARGLAVGDLDNDGDLDIVINTLDGPPVLARNTAITPARSRGHWLTLRLHGDPRKQCPRDAIGATVIVTAAGGHRVRGEVASGRGYLSQSDLRVHIDLGEATRIDTIEVRWPNGANIIYPGGRVDAIVDIDEATGPR